MLKNRLVRTAIAAAAVVTVALSTGTSEVSAEPAYPPATTQPPTELRSLQTSFSSVCLEGVPYVQYSITPIGFESNGPATITIRDANGGVISTFVVSSLSGQFLYPGANSDGTVLPGWLFVNGEWVEDSTNALYRQGLSFDVEVNPTASGTASYPPETTTCADPTQGGDPGDPAEPSSSTGVLPSTGSNATMIILVVGTGLLGAGIVTSVSMRRRHA